MVKLGAGTTCATRRKHVIPLGPAVESSSKRLHACMSLCKTIIIINLIAPIPAEKSWRFCWGLNIFHICTEPEREKKTRSLFSWWACHARPQVATPAEDFLVVRSLGAFVFPFQNTRLIFPFIKKQQNLGNDCLKFWDLNPHISPPMPTTKPRQNELFPRDRNDKATLG